MGRNNDMVVIIENPQPESERQPVLETVGFILGRVEFKLHALLYVIHT
jgi:hypothetical protein